MSEQTRLYSGPETPDGAVLAEPGSVFLRVVDGVGSFYYKAQGESADGWIAATVGGGGGGGLADPGSNGILIRTSLGITGIAELSDFTDLGLAVVGGSDTQLQFNNAGALDGVAGSGVISASGQVSLNPIFDSSGGNGFSVGVVNSGTGTGTLVGIETVVNNETADALDAVYGMVIKAAADDGGGSATDVYGLSIYPITGGSENYAIQTRGGLVECNGVSGSIDIDPDNSGSPAISIEDNDLNNTNLQSTFLKLGALPVSGLPSAGSSTGFICIVSDSTPVTAEGQTAVGGGSVTALVISDGVNWKAF